MFHPIGSQPSSVYWRRRVVVLASCAALLVLVVLTARVLLSGGGGQPAAASGTSSPHTSPPVAPTTTRPTSTSAAPRTSDPKSTSGSPSGSRSSSVPPAPCQLSALGLAAATNARQYSVGDQPVLSIQVTNKGALPCVVDLADPQIVLRVYNGESRVWGSHDCKIEPGTDRRTLMAGATVKVSIVWSGLSSQPNCTGTRERVGAGTYTLYASLDGHEGKAAQFTLK